MAPAEARWRALVALESWDDVHAHVASLMQQWETLPEQVQRALACMHQADMAPARRLPLLYDTIAAGGDLGSLAGLALTLHDAWLGFVHDGVDPELRAFRAANALSAPSAPEDRGALEDEIGRVFSSGLLGAEASARAFGAMVDAGWRPSPALLTRIARGAHSRLANRILDHVVARGADVDDAPALTALRDRGHGERVDPMLAALREGLDAKMVGRLSVSQSDGAQGGLTEAGGGGELEVVGEE